MRCCGKEISQGSGPPKTSTDRWIGVNDYYHLLSEAAKELNPRLFREGRDNLAKTNQNDEGGGLARRLSNQRGHLKGLWENSRTGQTVTGVAEHALHEEARVVGAAAAAAAVFAGVGAQQTVTAGTKAAASHTEILGARTAGGTVQYATEAVIEVVPHR